MAETCFNCKYGEEERQSVEANVSGSLHKETVHSIYYVCTHNPRRDPRNIPGNCSWWEAEG